MKKLIQKWLGITKIESDLKANEKALKFILPDAIKDIENLKKQIK